MPADRITSYSPWHIVLVIHDSRLETTAAIRDAVQWLVSEIDVIERNRPCFILSVVTFGPQETVHIEANSAREIGMSGISVFTKCSESTRSSTALHLAEEILKRHPGKAEDFRPHVFFILDVKPDAHDRSAALDAAVDLKSLNVAAGAPLIWAIGWGDVEMEFMESVASKVGLFKKLPNVETLGKFLPAIVAVASGVLGELALIDAIKTL
jgi:uncharacterized protein YegL